MIKTNSILCEYFLNAVQTVCTLRLNSACSKSPSTITCVMTHGKRWKRTPFPKLKHNSDNEIERDLLIKYRFKKIINSINCHLCDEIKNSNNRILHYKSGVNISTLGISLLRYNYKFGFLLDFSPALSGVPCSMEYDFRDNESICSEKKLSWLINGVEC